MTHGISPKVIAAVLSALVGTLATRFALELPREVEFLIPPLATFIAGYLAPPGDVIVDEGPASDDLLDIPADDPNLEPAGP
jgi:hypothetical protein